MGKKIKRKKKEKKESYRNESLPLYKKRLQHRCFPVSLVKFCCFCMKWKNFFFFTLTLTYNTSFRNFV